VHAPRHLSQRPGASRLKASSGGPAPSCKDAAAQVERRITPGHLAWARPADDTRRADRGMKIASPIATLLRRRNNSNDARNAKHQSRERACALTRPSQSEY
jgi:hypothetical protein